MEDEAKTVADYKIVENGFIVMMTVKVSVFRLEKLFKSPMPAFPDLSSEMDKVTLVIADSSDNFIFQRICGEKATIYMTLESKRICIHNF